MNTISRPSKRLARWIAEFQEWKLKIKYRRGSEAVVSDALSQRPHYMLNVMRGLALHEEYVQFMEEYLLKGTLPQNEFVELVRLKAPHFLIQEGRLMWTIEGVIAPYLEWEFVEDFIQRMHEKYGHLSQRGMRDLVWTRAWWPKLDQDVQEFVKSCPNCQ